MEQPKQTVTLEQLKAKAYDIAKNIEYLTKVLEQINTTITKATTPVETKKQHIVPRAPDPTPATPAESIPQADVIEAVATIPDVTQ